MGAQVMAQGNGDIWTPAVNVSQSGTALNPVIAAAPNGVLHVLWWDDLDGEQYARTNLTSTVWTRPVNVPQIIGQRQVDAQTNRVTLTEPRSVVLTADAGNRAHAFWFDAADQLLHAQTAGAAWSDAAVLAEAATILSTATDASGALHLAYTQSADSPERPAGLYYRVNSEGRWSPPSLIHASSYFRAAQPEALHLSLAGNNRGQLVVAWDEPQLQQSQLAFSLNNGTDWSAPLPLSNTQSLPVRQVSIAAAPNDNILMLWQDTGTTNDCTFAQRVSSDGGQTWSAPVRIFNSSTLCQQTLSFMSDADGRLWLIGQPSTHAPTANLNSVTVISWDGQAWSPPTVSVFNTVDGAGKRTAPLSCLNVSIAGQTAGIVGCDSNQDAYAARNAVELSQFSRASQRVWAPLEFVSDQNNPASIGGLADVAADQQGNLYAVWSQGISSNLADTALYGTTYNNGQWSNPVIMLRSPENTQATSTKAEQPAIAIDAAGKAQVVWTAGTIGTILHSWAYSRDFESAQNWSDPQALPVPASTGSWPDIVADPRTSDLFVVYTIPYNEQRGVYLVPSRDGGTTWLTPTLIFDAAMARWDSLDKAHLALDPVANILHVTWLRTALPGNSAAQEVYYARSTDHGQTWSSPLKVVTGAVDWPRISAFTGGQVYLAWNVKTDQDTSNTATPFDSWGQFSIDGGIQWSNPAAVPGFGRISGPVDLFANEAGTLHIAAIGQETENQSALTLARWMGQTWGDRETVNLGQGPIVGNAASLGIASQTDRLNVLMRLYGWVPNNTGKFEIAVTSRTVTPVVVTPIPTFTPLPPATASPTPTPSPTATPRPQLPPTSPQPGVGNSGPPPLILGIALAAIIVIMAVIRATVLRRK